MKRVAGYLSALLLTLFATQCLAAGVLKLSRTELTLEAGKPVRSLYVENTGDTPLYLDVEQALLLNPGQTPEGLQPIREVERPTLLVTPDKLALAPGQKRRMMIKGISAPAQTQVWRVTFRPRERLVIDSNVGSAPIVVSVGYGVVIYQFGLR